MESLDPSFVIEGFQKRVGLNGLKNGIFTYTSDLIGTRQEMFKNDELVP